MAQRAWEAAIACTGREPATHPIVPIERVPEGAQPAAGLAQIDEEGLAQILLEADAPAVVLAHEIGHAWIHTGPAALVEGRTELLAECIAGRIPDDVRFLRDDRYLAEDMPELRAWEGFVEGSDPDEVSAGYAGAWRLFQAMRGTLPAQELWDPELTSWEALEQRLETAGSGGAVVLSVLSGGQQAQRAALEDHDRDGLVWLYEELHDTSPDHWDSDGDGWWDGASGSHPEGAIPIARDGSPVCVPWVRPSGRTRVVYGGNLRGHDLSTLEEPISGEAGVLWLGGGLISARGGHWLHVPGESLQPNPHCAWTPRATVVVDGEVGAGVSELQDFAEALSQVAETFEERLGPAPSRLYVTVDRRPRVALTKRAEQPNVHVPVAMLRGALGSDSKMEVLLYQVTARHWLAGRSGRSEAPELAVALSQDLLERRTPILVEGYRREVNELRRIVARCPDTWASVLSGGCLERWRR